MANVNSTLSRTQSKPEQFALWLFKSASNWRLILALLLIVALTIISITFNILLGQLSGADSISEVVLPIGYALLDLSALFLSGYIGLKAVSLFKKALAWLWFGFLLCLSLWAAASFTLAIDSQTQNEALERSIDQKQTELYAINSDVDLWRDNVANTERFRTRYQQKLESIQDKQQQTSSELDWLESSKPEPTMAIYNMVAPLLGFTPETLQTFVRLLWAGALTLSPLVIMLLISSEKESIPQKPKSKAQITTTSRLRRFLRNVQGTFKKRQAKRKLKRLLAEINSSEHRETHAELRTTSGTQHDFPEAPEPEQEEDKTGNNQHTEVLDLRAFEAATNWLLQQKPGRVTRATIGKACGLYNRIGVSKIVAALLESGALERLSNGQLAKPRHP